MCPARRSRGPPTPVFIVRVYQFECRDACACVCAPITFSITLNTHMAHTHAHTHTANTRTRKRAHLRAEINSCGISDQATQRNKQQSASRKTHLALALRARSSIPPPTSDRSPPRRTAFAHFGQQSPPKTVRRSRTIIVWHRRAHLFMAHASEFLYILFDCVCVPRAPPRRTFARTLHFVFPINPKDIARESAAATTTKRAHFQRAAHLKCFLNNVNDAARLAPFVQHKRIAPRPAHTHKMVMNAYVLRNRLRSHLECALFFNII